MAKMKKTEFMESTEGIVGLGFMVFWSLVSIVPLMIACVPIVLLVDVIDLAFPGTTAWLISTFADLIGTLMIIGGLAGFFMGIFPMIGKLFAVAVVTTPVFFAKVTRLHGAIAYPFGVVFAFSFWLLVYATSAYVLNGYDTSIFVGAFVEPHVNLWNAIVGGN